MAVERLGSVYTTAVTTGGSANTKGSWTQLIASTSGDITGIIISWMDNENNYGLYDIGVGAAAAETAVIQNAWFCGRSGRYEGDSAYHSVNIASGSRISIRTQGGGASQTTDFSGYGFDSSGLVFGGGTAETWGAVTASSRGTSIDPGTTANTKGSYVELVASTSNTVDWVTVYIGHDASYSHNYASYAIDIATGAASSEVVIIPDIWAYTDATEDVLYPMAIGPFAVNIPSGTRISARCQCTITTADRVISVHATGMTATAGGAGGGQTFHGNIR